MKTLHQDAVLAHIKAHPGCTSNDISEAFGISTNRAAGSCANVFEKQLVRREKLKIGTKRAAFAYWINEEPAKPVIPKTPEPIRKIEPPAIVAPALAPAAPVIHGLESMLDGIASSFVDVLATKIKTGLAGRLQTMITAPVAPAAPQQVAENDPEPELPASPEQMELITEAPKSSQAIRRIGIVGILPNNIPEIDAEFGKVFRISYWHQNGHSGWDRLKAIAEFCDLVFVVKRHVSHRTTVHLQSNNANTLLIDGGVTTLKIALLEYLQGKVAA